MKHLDPNSLAVAKQIVAALPVRSNTEQTAEVLTALTVVSFAIAKELDIEPTMLGFGILELSATADAAIEELKNEGVNV